MSDRNQKYNKPVKKPVKTVNSPKAATDSFTQSPFGNKPAR